MSRRSRASLPDPRRPHLHGRRFVLRRMVGEAHGRVLPNPLPPPQSMAGEAHGGDLPNPLPPHLHGRRFPLRKVVGEAHGRALPNPATAAAGPPHGRGCWALPPPLRGGANFRRPPTWRHGRAISKAETLRCRGACMVSPRLGPDHLRYARERKVATLSGRQRRVAEIREGAAWTVWRQEDSMTRCAGCGLRAACCGLTVGPRVWSAECGVWSVAPTNTSLRPMLGRRNLGGGLCVSCGRPTFSREPLRQPRPTAAMRTRAHHRDAAAARPGGLTLFGATAPLRSCGLSSTQDGHGWRPAKR